MGATIICKKAAQAFLANDGVVRYVLFESTYEKNVHPHTPHWGAVAVGNYDEVIETVIRFSAVLPGGLLRGKTGQILPENYIAHWRQLLQKPLTLLGTRASLFWSDTDTFLNDTVEKRLASVNNVLASLSPQAALKWTEALQNFQKTSISIDVCEDVELVLALIRSGTVPAWRIFADSRPDEREPFAAPPGITLMNRQETDAAPKRFSKQSTVELKLPSVANLGFGTLCDRYIISMDGKTWSSPQTDYRHESNFISDHLKAAEIAQPGVAKRALPQLRQLLANARTVADCTKVTIIPRPVGGEQSSYSVESAQRLMEQLGGSPQHECFDTTLGAIRMRGEGAQYAFTCLKQEQISWGEMQYKAHDAEMVAA